MQEAAKCINQSINRYSFITGMPERRPNNRIIYKYNVTNTVE